MTANTIARVNGMAAATTAPGRKPRLTKLAARMIRIACHSDSMKSLMAVSTVAAWSATSVGSIPSGRLARILATSALIFRPRARMSPPSRIAIARPIAGLPLTRNIGCGGSTYARCTSAMSPRRMFRPPNTKFTLRMESSLSKAPVTRKNSRSLPGLQHPGRTDEVLRPHRIDQRTVVKPERGKPLGRELDEDLLVLRAEDFDLRDIGHIQQSRPRILDIVSQLSRSEPVGYKAVNDAERLSEVVVEAGANDPLRQRAPDVADVLAHLVPDIRVSSKAVSTPADRRRSS